MSIQRGINVNLLISEINWVLLFPYNRDFSHQIMSIFIPKGYSMTVYNLENFQGEKTVYKES